jgi:hypothetical protein
MRDATPTRWLIEGLVPAGAIVGIADAEDGTPQEILDQGFDVVLHLSEHELTTGPVLMTVLWRDGLVPGRRPPAPFWVRFTGHGFVRVDESEAA